MTIYNLKKNYISYKLMNSFLRGICTIAGEFTRGGTIGVVIGVAILKIL